MSIVGLIYWMIGPCIFCGLVVMIAYIPAMRVVGAKQKAAQVKKQQAADERVKVCSLR